MAASWSPRSRACSARCMPCTWSKKAAAECAGTSDSARQQLHAEFILSRWLPGCLAASTARFLSVSSTAG
jgi:hypothetical protein